MNKNITPAPELPPLASFRYTLAPGATASNVLNDASLLLCAAIDVLETIEDREAVPAMFAAIHILKQVQRLVRMAPTEGATA